MHRSGLIIALSCAVIDQLSKLAMMTYFLADFRSIPVTSFFYLTPIWNPGIGFGMLQKFGLSVPLIMVGFGTLITLFLLNLLRTTSSKNEAIGYGLIIGGALGNLIDRLHFGAVYDFLHVFVRSYHWPIFNVADSFVCIGAGFILLTSLRKKED